MRFSLRLVGPRPLSGEIRAAFVRCTPGPMWRCRTGRHNQRGSFCTEIPPNARSAVCVCARAYGQVWEGRSRMPPATGQALQAPGMVVPRRMSHREHGWGTPQVCRGHAKSRPMLCVCARMHAATHGAGRAPAPPTTRPCVPACGVALPIPACVAMVCRIF